MTMEIQENPVTETNSSQSSNENQNNNNNNDNNNTQSKANEDANGDLERQLSSGNSSVIDDKEEHEEDNLEDDQDEDLQLGDTSKYDVNERNALFQRGLEYDKKGKQGLALKCYFGCVNGLERKTHFALLPECLHNIADIYQSQGNYERAIHFAQAEKLFYESALIESQEIQKKIEEIAGDDEHKTATDLNELNIESMRAEEYEHLARLCLDNNQAQLALEYAGKCAKIRQNVYGDNHAKTKETLDFFASLYAEVGKEQYSDSFTLLSSITSEEYEAPEVVMSPPSSGEPVSILRQRSTALNQKKDEGSSGQAEREKKQVRFHESVEEAQRNKEEFASLTVTFLLLIVCFIILLALGLWLYCALERGHSCRHFNSKFQSWIMNIRYFFHSRTAPKFAYSR